MDTARETTTRERIVDAADRLFYHRGFDHTSFADIADEVQISRGNFYYHFKTKDELLDAVIAQRLASTGRLLAEWEREAKRPADRIRCFIRILVTNRGEIERYGCPVGTLCSELAKTDHGARAGASELFTLFRTWLRRELAKLGRRSEADALAMHLLARTQGIAVLAQAFPDEDFIAREVEQLHAWLDAHTRS